MARIPQPDQTGLSPKPSNLPLASPRSAHPGSGTAPRDRAAILKSLAGQESWVRFLPAGARSLIRDYLRALVPLIARNSIEASARQGFRDTIEIGAGVGI